MNKQERFPHLCPTLANPDAAQDMLLALAQVKWARAISGPMGICTKVYSEATRRMVDAAIAKATMS